MSDEEVENWMTASENVALRLRNAPDPSKPDPSFLIVKMQKRANAMREHLQVRKNIVKSAKELKPSSGNMLEQVMLAASVTAMKKLNGSTGSTVTSLTPQDSIWAPDTKLRTLPPHKRPEDLTIDFITQKDGEIDVDKEKFVFNENGQ